MEIRDLIKYLNKHIEVYITDGRVFKGHFTNIENPLDTMSNKYEVEIMTPDYCIGIPINTINHIKIIY